MSIHRRKFLSLGAGAAAVAAVGGTASAGAEATAAGPLPDAALAASLPGGFRSAFASVNGLRLHYVAGGRGEPLVLLPGWPQTWWEFHKVMPALAERYRVIAVDMRGMGSSGKPPAGYDKKTMAADIAGLARQLGYASVNIAGHDIGAMVAHSFAVNHRDATRKVALMDVGHPTPQLNDLRLLPQPHMPHLWWFAFNQVHGLPEEILAGRFRPLVDYLFDNLAKHPEAFGERARMIYARAYSARDAIRAGNGWYQTFGQDIADFGTYGLITAPLLGLASEFSYPFMRDVWAGQGTDVRVVEVTDSGHFLPEEQPAQVIRALTEFLG